VQPNQIIPALLGLVGVFTFLVLSKEKAPDTSEALSALDADRSGIEAAASSDPSQSPTVLSDDGAAAAAQPTATSAARSGVKPIVRVGGGAFKSSGSGGGSFKRISISAN
jgi:hypothetical protein